MNDVNSRTDAILSSRLVPIQQLGNGSMGVIEYMRLMIPHKLVKGKLYTIEGKDMPELNWDGMDDCTVVPKKLFEQKTLTQAWRNEVIAKVNHNLLNVGGNFDRPAVEVIDDDDDDDNMADLEFLISGGKRKKAKKLLELFKEDLTKNEYKAYKFRIKGLKNG